MSNSPVISVIVPCYNQGVYLDEAVRSVLAQTYPDWEIIVVNDGSTDPETIEILETYQAPKTTLIHTENRGVASARNTAIERAIGKYILPLDADDKIAPTYLAEAVGLLEENARLGIVYSEAEYFGDRQGVWELSEYRFPEILLDNMIFCSGFFRKSDWEAVGGYNPNLIYGWEDHDFWLSLLELDRQVYRIPRALFFYRQKAVSRSRSMTAEQYIHSYTTLFHNHPRLYSENIEAVFSSLVTLKVDIFAQLERARKQIGELETELVRTQSDYQERDAELQQALAKIEAMEASNFWKLRRVWNKGKKILFRDWKDPIYS